MTTKMEKDAAALHVEVAFDQAKRLLYTEWKAQRSAELKGIYRKSRDGRGFDNASLEAGRIDALVALCPHLSIDLRKLREDAREDAEAEWREELFASYLPKTDEPA